MLVSVLHSSQFADNVDRHHLLSQANLGRVQNTSWKGYSLYKKNKTKQNKTKTEQTKTKLKQTEGTLNGLEISINVMGSRTMYFVSKCSLKFIRLLRVV